MEEKILITGAKGFIGSHLLKFYPEADTLDLKDGQDIRTFPLDKEYTHIFHLAALRSASHAEENPEEFISTNCFGTVRLLKRYPNARFMNVTSASAENVRGIYGATKKFAEIVGSLYSNVINVRPYNVFGEGQGIDSNAVIPLFIQSYLENKKPVIYGDGYQKRDFTYVGDVVKEMSRLMFQAEPNLYHCGYKEAISIWGLIRLIWGYIPEVIFSSQRSFDVQVSESPYPMEYEEPPIGREAGLKRTIEWMRSIHGR